MDTSAQIQRLRTAHSPGPWRVSGCQLGNKLLIEHGDAETFSPVLCSVYADEGRLPQAGNAILIASAPTLLAALENIECPDCGHLLKCHADKQGCEIERDDKWIDSGNGDRLVAPGPCSCTCEDLPDLQAAIEAIRLAKGGR